MKILSAAQIREGDAYTIKHEPIKSIDLMERAAACCFDWIYQNAPKLFPVNSEEKNWVFNVFCGVGNNGGDGLVIARMLHRHGYHVNVFIVEFSKQYSPDFEFNLARIQKLKVAIKFIAKSDDLPSLEPDSLVIDAIFGTGINRQVDGIAAEVIRCLNSSGAKIVAVDVPSGLFDYKNDFIKHDLIVRAAFTLTFQFFKLSLLFPENQEFVGVCKRLDIGIHSTFADEVKTNYFYTQEEDILTLIKPRNKQDHKGVFGHLLIAAGSYGKIGAACLSAKGALKSGVGLVSVFGPKIAMPIVQTAVCEAMFIASPNDDLLEGEIDTSPYDAIAIGPGIGVREPTQQFVKKLLRECNSPIVLDADALNCLSLNKDWLSFIPENSILTPHPGEFKRLVGTWDNEFDRLEKQIQYSKNYKVIVVLKGAHTSISCPDGRVFFNSTGNPGMATAGSGDVLTGILGSLLAQGYEPLNAAILGVYLHGRAGDIALWDTGYEALTASDVISCLGKAFLSFTLPSNL